VSLKSKLSQYPKSKAGWMDANCGLFTTCEKCEREFVKGEHICIVETQVSFMRGDDESEAFCAKCAIENGHVQPPTKREKRIANLRIEIERIQSRIANGSSRNARRDNATIAVCQRRLDEELAKEQAK
jgi:hypothetical protein